MNTFFIFFLVAFSLFAFSGCSSKDAKDKSAKVEQENTGANDSLVFEDQSEDEFFGTGEDTAIFDNEVPAEALGEVTALEEPAMPPADGSNDESFGNFDPAASGEADPFAAVDPGAPAEVDPFAAAAGQGGDVDFADPFGESADYSDTSFGEQAVPSEPAAPLGDGFFESPPAESNVAVLDDVESDEFSSGSGLVPVKKIKDVPFRRAGQLLNTVYIVRPNDTLESLSQKIYGFDRSQDILAANPHLNRSFKPGDKVYYNSPARPNDESQILTFHADRGMVADVYTSKEGDNIRKVSSDLLGYDGAWKEVWATNPEVESKWLLTAGVQLKYWKDDGSDNTGGLAQNSSSPEAMVEEPAPPVDESPELVAAPPQEFAPPAPPAQPEAPLPTSEAVAGSMEPEDYPEPQMADFESLPPAEPSDFQQEPSEDFAMNDLPPPPPPPPLSPPAPDSFSPSDDGSKGLANVEEAESDDPMAMIQNMDDDMLMLLAALGVIILGGGSLMMIKRSKARQLELENALSDHTQVG